MIAELEDLADWLWLRGMWDEAELVEDVIDELLYVNRY